MAAEEDIVQRLSRLDTCAVSDALDRLGLHGATTGVGPLWPCPRICGRAVSEVMGLSYESMLRDGGGQ